MVGSPFLLPIVGCILSPISSSVIGIPPGKPLNDYRVIDLWVYSRYFEASCPAQKK